MDSILKIKIIILLVSPIASARISVNIRVNTSIKYINITHTGFDNKLITSLEMKAFNITDEKLMRGMRVELGKFPDRIYLKDPTKFGDTFKKFKWQGVTRRVKVKEVRVLDIINKEIVLDQHEHINSASTNITTKRIMYRTVENSAETKWFNDGLPKDEMFYDLILDFGYGQWKYKNKWKTNRLRAANMVIGTSKEGNIDIQPGQSVITKLSATKSILLFEIVYEARLFGNIVADFDYLYGKYHFYAPTMTNIMIAANMNNSIITRERVEVKCYLEPTIEVYDKLTGVPVVPPWEQRKMVKIFRNKNSTSVIHFKNKKPLEDKKKSKIKKVK